MANSLSLDDLSRQAQFSPIVEAVQAYYRQSGANYLRRQLVEIIGRIVADEARLISATTGAPICYGDLRALRVSDILDATVPRTDRSCGWRMRDILKEWIRKDFERSCLGNVRSSMWGRDRNTALEQALRRPGIREDMMYQDMANLDLVDPLLEVPTTFIDDWATRHSVYSLFVAETTSGFLSFDAVDGWPHTYLKHTIAAHSKAWDKPFDAHWDLRFQFDKAEVTGIGVDAITVALVDDDDWVGLADFMILSPTTDRLPSNDELRDMLANVEEGGVRSEFAAEALGRQYGTPLVFEKGSIALLLDCEIVTEYRGRGIGLRFIEEALREIKRVCPTVRSVAWQAEPRQFYLGEWEERRPAAIEAEYQASKRRLREYCLSHEARIAAVLSDSEGDGRSLMYEDMPAPSVFELFSLDEERIEPVPALCH